jgi:hypothetical protein
MKKLFVSRAAIALGLILIMAGGMAQAQTSSRTVRQVEGQEIILNNGNCLSLTTDGSLGPTPQAQALTCMRYRDQRWMLEATGPNRNSGFLIHPVGFNLCLTLDPSTVFSLGGNVVGTSCNSADAFQRWIIVPVTESDFNPERTSYAVLNVGHAKKFGGGMSSQVALSLPLDADPTNTFVMMRLFEAADAQKVAPLASPQLWRGEEIWCMLTQRKHAAGWNQVSWGDPRAGYTTSYNPLCK